MARPIKKGLDYFPLDVNLDDNLELIEAEHGLSGFAIVLKLWQKIYSSGYYIEWNEDSALLFARKINSEITLINSVINSCFNRSIFNKTLFDKYGILTSSGIQKRFLTVCKSSKRTNISFIKEFILVNSEFTDVITETTELNPELSTQRKVKKSKGEDKPKKPKDYLSQTYFEKSKELNSAFIDYLDLRIKNKYTMTDRAVNALITKLRKLSNGNIGTALKIIDEAIIGKWKSFYELKDK